MAASVDHWAGIVDGAGQGAHREVGSEGFEAKHRAVADVANRSARSR
jgi:hypothetical protein